MNNKPELEVLTPDWPAPENIQAFFTLRAGGLSAGPYGAKDGFNGLNLGMHAGDSPYAVRANRRMVKEMLGFEPAWLRQIHSARVLPAESVVAEPEADAAFTFEMQVPCAVMTADCVPILLCDKKGSAVAAVHAGWRGLADGVIQETVRAMQEAARRKIEASAQTADSTDHPALPLTAESRDNRALAQTAESRDNRVLAQTAESRANQALPQIDKSLELMAWIGPHIRKAHFEVRGDVVGAFRNSPLGAALDEAIEHVGDDQYRLDLARLCREALHLAGVKDIYDCLADTYADADRFYSYRREGITGRHGAFICRK